MTQTRVKSEPYMFSPEQYFNLLKRSSIETMAHLRRALEVDLSMEELKALCNYFHCSAGNIDQVLAKELNL